MSAEYDMGGSNLKLPKPEELQSSLAEYEPWKLWHMIVAVFFAAVLFWAFLVIGGWLGVLLIMLLFAIFIGWIFTTIRGASGQRYSLLWMLAIAAEHKMPLATTVEAFANQYRGRFRRRVLKLAVMLSQGAPLSHALRSIRGLSSPDANILVEVGEEAGRLAPALRRAAAVHASRSTLGQTLASQASYLLVVLMMAQTITSFLLYFIVPKFEAIFNDFGVGLPATTRAIITASHWAVRFLVPIWLPLLTLTLLLMIPIALTSGTMFEMPILGRLFPRRHSATILRSLSMCAESGQPIEKGLHTLAARYPVSWVRRRLARAEQNALHGMDWREALRREKLINTTDHEVLATSSAVGNLPWAMNDLADAIDRRQRLKIAMLSQAFWPIVIVAIAALVLFLAVGFFTPLVTLIARLSG
ncbi:type II secretion system F family protein [Paludisphaera rhizosphaerae]|uniref:type II secretion system F family protein n=1 Tax=Paludisphaera rhizosphaerae TaxID=2711216 RepID=UPI0013E9F137|nr:type II secretion system F family protein [Paludisphaera rhizosphaerae]